LPAPEFDARITWASRLAALNMNDIQHSNLRYPDGVVTLFITNLVLEASIGIYASERTVTQRVAIDITVRVENCAYPYTPTNVLDYNHLRDGVKGIVEAGHIDYQETFCAQIVSMCLALPHVSFARVRVAKLDAFSDCTAVGCEIERANGDTPGYVHRAFAAADPGYALR
jgi:7,8-dihydroneopterin aldolase/epimerase/oxygenase